MVSEFGVHEHFGPVAVGPMVVELYVVMVENVKTGRSVMLHTDSPSLREAEAGGSLCVQGQTAPHSKTISKNQNKQTEPLSFPYKQRQEGH